jgi:hypothetical protein
MEALSVHIVHEETIPPKSLLQTIRRKLHDEFGIDHLTIQMETAEEETTHECFSGVNCFDTAQKSDLIAKAQR